MQKGIKSISIIGSGNVAFHLGKAFLGLVKIHSVYSRNDETGHHLSTELNAYFAEEIEQLLPADLILVCVNDDSIQEIVAQLPIEARVAYTSGAVGMSDCHRSKNLGVLYPLQSFSKNVSVDFFQVPFFIEATDEYFAQDLYDLSYKLSRKVVFANSTDRKNLHLAAVLVNNFSNHIHTLAQDFLKEKNLEFSYLIPLIEETTRKIIQEGPANSQTGPAKRRDQSSMEKHLALLNADMREIYALFSKSIQNKHSDR